MGDKMETRQLFYICREHLMESHWAEAIACGRLFLEARGGWPERRAQVACFIAQAWTALNDLYQARLAYLDALKEWGNWAEPYYGLALVHRDLGMFREAIAWGTAACLFEPTDEVSNQEIYSWRRFDVMAFCLAQIGRFEQAVSYYEKVAAAHPNPTTEANLRRCKQFMNGKQATEPIPV
jgi:tetratricopeptide (TPR) repeat protein